ncbi:MAG TPA: hypothetical protein DCE47_20125 [Planctomycetaceae bacterium]|nr:hypothetical protein [Planctomycetaceae bacterium]HCD01595.1 hypothetical protein [Planctomycetaceae bacterium]
MASMQIPCPECGSILKLPDRSMLGKKGRCPSCRHTFVLAEPEEVELELADSPTEETPQQGTSARWVSDEPATAPPDLAGKVDPPAEVAGEAREDPAVSDPPAVGGGGFPVFDDAASTTPSRKAKRRSRPKKASRKQEKRPRGGPSLAVIVGSSIVALAVIGVGVTWFRSGSAARQTVTKTNVDDATVDTAEPEIQTLPVSNPGQTVRPIRLDMVPAGVSIVINVRPDELWAQESPGEELRFCLGPLGEWAGEQIKTLCRFPPEEIEEAMICLMLGQRGDPPEVAVVLRLKEAQKPSTLLERFPGPRSDDYSYPVYLGDTHCYLRGSDAKTVAIGPLDRVEEMAAAVRQPAVTTTGIEQILPLTSRDKLLTVVFEPRDARNFQEVLVSETIAPVFNLVLDWFDDEEIETVAWSIDIDRNGDEFESEILLRNHHSHNSIVTPGRLERSVQKRLGSLPVEMMHAVEKMRPSTVGAYRLISRFPALMSAYVFQTDTAVGDRHVQLRTRLPERAAPNIALAALLTWDESTRTDFTAAAPRRVAQVKTLPETVAGRLGMKIEVDFRRTPLQEAVKFVAEEIQVPFEIDGDALKLSGYTKNMPQTIARAGSAKSVLHEIMKKYKGMVIVVDEGKKQITLMTQPVAEKMGLKPFPVAD